MKVAEPSKRTIVVACIVGIVSAIGLAESISGPLSGFAGANNVLKILLCGFGISLTSRMWWRRKTPSWMVYTWAIPQVLFVAREQVSAPYVITETLYGLSPLQAIGLTLNYEYATGSSLQVGCYVLSSAVLLLVVLLLAGSRPEKRRDKAADEIPENAPSSSAGSNQRV